MPVTAEAIPTVDAKAPGAPNALVAARQRYDEERQKRLRADGLAQFVNFTDLDKFKHWKVDIWADKNDPIIRTLPVPTDGARSEFLVVGAGYSGLLHAARLIQAGFKPEDIQMTDTGTGFGGTWYWNRYPGLMCDIESYIYMPLLEETSYMPKHKYAMGTELREHADRIARHFSLTDRVWFRTNIRSLEWDDNIKEWITTLTHVDLNEVESAPMKVRSRFVVLTGGYHRHPQVPQIEGIDKFKGPTFHTARWDYKATGGSQTDPRLVNLQGKTVAVVGTGATAIQVVPAVAQWAGRLLVFQRTPSAVDRRANVATDPEVWRNEIAPHTGWQKARRFNFGKYVQNAADKPAVNLVNDSWTELNSYTAFVGSPEAYEAAQKDPAALAEKLHELDLERAERIRKRTEDIVKNRETAEKLKPWYPSWCKRPCFHDEYLQSFNMPNVSLVDTNGRGIDACTEDGIIVNGEEYKIDILILATGYASPFLSGPGKRCDIVIHGRKQLELESKWDAGIRTLHGMMSHDFPNMFWPALYQGGGTPNFMTLLDYSAEHIAGIMAEARKRNKDLEGSGSYKYNFVVETTQKGEETYSDAIAAGAITFAALAGCTPSYFNFEGEIERDARIYKKARMAFWAKGAYDWEDILNHWREKKEFPELAISGAPK
ncbi:hypothetical protein RBB50_012500 [Rhinocladiella similis]